MITNNYHGYYFLFSGVVALNGTLYVLGGWRGQTGVSSCEQLSSDFKCWNSIAPMNVGKFRNAYLWNIVYCFILV